MPTSEALDLIARAVQHAQKQDIIADPQPRSRDELARLERTIGCALPPSLRAFLAFDAGWLVRELGWSGDAFSAAPLAQLIEGHAGALFEAYSPLVQARLRGRAFPLDAGSDSMRYLWLGDPDADGETPVLFADHDDSAILGVEFPSFAVWVADALGVWKEGVAYNRFKGARQEVSLRVFGKKNNVQVDGKVPKKLSPIVPAPPPGAHDAMALPVYAAVAKKKKTDEALLKSIEQNAESGDLTRVAPMIEEVRARGLDGARLAGALLIASTHQRVELAQLLIDAGAPADARGHYGSALAQASTTYGEKTDARALALMDLLLAAGADPSGASGAADTLNAAATSGSPVTIRRLFAAGAKPPADAPTGVGVLLAMATERDVGEIVDALVEGGCAVDATEGTTGPLHRAAMRGHRENVAAMIRHGARLDARDEEGETPLHQAFRYGLDEVAEMLVRAGARRDLPTARGVMMTDVFGVDGRDARAIESHYRASSARQTLTIALRVTGPLNRTARLPAFLTLGLATTHFPCPRVSLTRDFGLSKAEVAELTATLEVEGIDPRVLALAARLLLRPSPVLYYRGRALQPLAIRVSGTAPPEESDETDGETLRAMVDDRTMSLETPTTPFPLHTSTGAGKLAIVTVAPLDDEARALLEQAATAWADALECLPRTDRPYGGRFSHVAAKRVASKKSAMTFEVGVRAFDDVENDTPFVDRERAFAMLRGVLLALHARVVVASAEASLH